VGEGLKGAKDDDLWPAVQRTKRFLITKDLEFSDARKYPPGTHEGIMVVRLSDDRSQAVAERLTSVLRGETVEDWGGLLIIVTDHKVRVRRPLPKKD
jgi:predicted nuclease of predicted toxin-antitoxin system